MSTSFPIVHVLQRNASVAHDPIDYSIGEGGEERPHPVGCKGVVLAPHYSRQGFFHVAVSGGQDVPFTLHETEFDRVAEVTTLHNATDVIQVDGRERDVLAIKPHIADDGRITIQALLKRHSNSLPMRVVDLPVVEQPPQINDLTVKFSVDWRGCDCETLQELVCACRKLKPDENAKMVTFEGDSYLLAVWKGDENVTEEALHDQWTKQREEEDA